jgi:magnesium transporter
VAVPPGELVDCAVYVSGVRLPGDHGPAEAMAEVRAQGHGFVWCGLYEPGDALLREAVEVFGLPPTALDYAAGTHHRPKLATYDDLLCMVLKTVQYVEHDSPDAGNEIVLTGEITTFVGKDFVLTVRQAEHSGLRGLRAELEAAPDRLRLGPAVVLHGIADRIVDSYLDVSESIENDIDTIEASVFEPRSRIGAEHMYLLKREIVELNRAVVPLTVPLRRILENSTTLIPARVRSYLRDVEDHLTTVAERVASYDDILTTLLNATLTKLSVQQNTDMRKITAWAAIIAVPTLVAGVYGMNFDNMPELRWPIGYPLVIGIMLLACTLLYVLFRRRDWL